MSDPRTHVQRNRAAWNRRAAEFAGSGRRHWGESEPRWGIWGVPEAELRALPDVGGRDVLELGCGTAYFSHWLALRGARVVGLDNSLLQLATARELQGEFGPAFPLLHGDGEQTPFADMSFDVVLSEYGACLWCDPHRWVPEAARVLRPGGELVFLTNSALLTLCEPEHEGVAATDRLLRDHFGMHRIEWGNDESVEFRLGHGDWIRCLRDAGFEILDLIEVRPPETATTRWDFVTLEWARRWPCEEIWRARRVRPAKRSAPPQSPRSTTSGAGHKPRRVPAPAWDGI